MDLPPEGLEPAPPGPRAQFGERLVAMLIDGFLVGGASYLLSLSFNSSRNALSTLLGLAYYIYLEGSPAGQTVGKKVMNIRVVDFAAPGEPIGYGRATIRYFSRIVSGIPLGLGYFWMLWDPEKQTWHDKFATSVVVPTSAYPVEVWPG